MLKALELENFKGVREKARIEFSPVTLLFGPNSAGKSTILQALIYLKEILTHGTADIDITEHGGLHIDFGGFLNIVNSRERDRKIKLAVEFSLADGELANYFTTDFNPEADALAPINPNEGLVEGRIELTIAWSELVDRGYVERYQVSLNNKSIGAIRFSPDSGRVFLVDLNFKHPSLLNDSDFCDYANYSELIDSQIPELLEEIEGSKDFQSELQSIVTELAKESPISSAVPLEIRIEDQEGAIPKWGRPLPLALDLPLAWRRNENLKNGKDERDETAVYSEARALQVESILSQVIVGPGEVLKEVLEKFIYLGPLREKPTRNFLSPRSNRKERWASGLGAWDELYFGDDSLVENVSNWMSKETCLRTGYSLQRRRLKKLNVQSALYVALQTGRANDELAYLFKELQAAPEEIELKLVDDSNGLEMTPSDVGVGISQVLPVVVAALSPRADIVAIEQPELHIHPSVQVGLGDLFLSGISSSEKCFLVETHSEHLMLRLLRRIRETAENDLPPDAPQATPSDVAVYFVEQNNNEGVTFRQLRVSEDGDFLDEWPHGFFRERADELF